VLVAPTFSQIELAFELSGELFALNVLVDQDDLMLLLGFENRPCCKLYENGEVVLMTRLALEKPIGLDLVLIRLGRLGNAIRVYLEPPLKAFLAVN
jgi:hypothetical protein